ncbi:hypothetical protein B0T19DRAFT_203234 [Cercophora scortea]|uniref:Uncharacterized protein n=1 Tax=Cercophora scortea TaxID=314031 RepID=A0AAE0IE27_9PEZI|nr:hypothetical protein B0T19DRAFT_203234 [Cercophora scortea]
MGLLSFFSRKPTDKGKTDGFPKAKAYHSASSGMLPVQGAYPVAGNGPNIIETLNNSRAKFSQTQLSLDGVPAADHAAPASAPAPTVPRYRDESLERPSTAPNGSQPSTAWGSASSRMKKGTMRGPPPVSFRMVSRGSANMDYRPTSRGTGETTEIPCAAHSHSRSNSIRSDGGRGFKDILDAQSEIRPADFKTRIKAAGARDYGEDVAERNMGENGFLLESPQVQAFYAQSANRSRQGPIDDRSAAAQHDLQSMAYAAGIRTKSLNSSSHYSQSLPKINSQVHHVRGSQLVDGSPFTKGPRRRRSLNTFMAVVSSNAKTGPLMDKNPHAGAGSGSGSKQPRQHAGTTGIEHTFELPPSQPNKGAPVVLPPPGMSHRPHTRPSKFPRDSVLVAKRRAGASTPDLHADDDPSSAHVPSERSFPLRSSFHSHRGSASASPASGIPRQRHSLHTLESSVSSPFASCETLGDVTPLAYPRTRSRHFSRLKQRQEEGSAGPGSLTQLAAVDSEGEGAASQTEAVDSAPSPPYSKAHLTIRETRESLDNRTAAATRSLTAASTHPNTSLDDVTEHSTLRTRSLRAWSSSSATPTASDVSSNSFQRPQSHHTANTSVDLSNASASLKASSHSSCAASPNTPKSANFNIDDYISSDDDSFTTAHRAAGAEGEEDLLFSDAGYGANGFQLPGLFDSLTSPSRAGPQQPSLAQRHHSSPALSSTGPSRRQMTYSGDSFGRAAGRRFVLDTAADSDYYSDTVPEYNDDDGDDDIGDGDDDGDSIFDGAVSKITRSPQRGATKRLSALRVHGGGNGGGGARHSVPNCYYTTDEVIEEENEGKVDVAAAVRLRKEAKQRKRAAGVSGRRAAKARAGGSSRSTFLNGEGQDKGSSHGLGLQVHIKVEGEMDEGEQADAE